MSDPQQTARTIQTRLIRKNPSNPRLFFNEESLDQLRTSIQEVGILVPLIVYEESDGETDFVLLDGERRWRCAVDLAIKDVPANIIAKPNDLENLLRMFNIHSVRDEWPLISVALSLRHVIRRLGDDRETQLSAITGLPRGTVRRAKRLLNLPRPELALIESEAAWDRSKQIHREDLYLEVDAAVGVILSELPELGEKYTREHIIRQFVRKREEDVLRAVTDFRLVAKLVKARSLIGDSKVVRAIEDLIDNVQSEPALVYDRVASHVMDQEGLLNRSNALLDQFEELREAGAVDRRMTDSLRILRDRINSLLGDL